ncbi:DNA translocase FtsK [Halioxenophilus sp. WMMB6]|uniref:DNA translocase FtsK n=1 Tax=Halioxenophilus sp. WMMB6 TaxID=3073815 RepID=UPI00295F3598|nr:DNA translocase FtsK 4TM domain-containing protein [Halioxenophilus sp. WMMB6]
MTQAETESGFTTGAHKLRRILTEGVLVILVALCLFLVLALVTYDATDPGWTSTGSGGNINNAGGAIGAWLADVFYLLFGYIAYLFPALIAVRIWRILVNRKREAPEFDWVLFALRLIGLAVVMVAGTGLVSLKFGLDSSSLPLSNGGILGATVSQSIESAFSFIGGTLILVALFLFGLTVFTDLSWLKVMESIGAGVLKTIAHFRTKREHKREIRTEREIAAAAVQERQESRAKRKQALEKAEPIAITPPKPKPKPSERVQKEKQATLFNEPVVGELPAISLLDPADHDERKGFSEESLTAMSKLLELKLQDFGISAEVVAVMPGPVVTRFELQPAPGIKAARITNLAKDLARSLAVISVRVVEVIPGKSVVGIEIPNEQRQMVRLSEVLESSKYDKAKSPLSLALGQDIAGEPVIADLAKMPHLLVAGTTGSGKSVGVNVMLLSLLFKSSPEEVRLILVDPKMLELSVYEGIPHLLTPVVTDMNDAANGLRWCVGEMERRYKLMAALGVRNIAGYNRQVEDAIKAGTPIKDPLFKPEEHYEPGAEEATAPDLETLPYIVVVIDEFADMMMIVGKKVEQLIARIAQKARAAGIHLILATQRPSVDVITGLIKANVPTRMAFQVSSKIDSRTIIDQGGAEQLLGHGDMLYLPPGSGVPVRVHGAFVDDHEVHKVVEDWKRRGSPNYLDEIVDESANSIPVPGLATEGGDDEDAESDPLYDEAVEFVTESRKASISSLQRKLRVGYNRAARLIETMEAAGVVSDMGPNGNRQVLAPPPPKH